MLTPDDVHPHRTQSVHNTEMTKRIVEFENGIQLEELDKGLLVRQYEDAYIARRWRLSDHTIELVRTASRSGFRWMIRKGHPQSHARWPSGKGRVYLAFSPTRENQWSVAIDSVNTKGDNYGIAVFNGKYRRLFDEQGIDFEFEKRNRTSGHLVIDRPRVLSTIQTMADFDHSVLYLGRSHSDDRCFATEYDIQRKILFEWSKTPFGASAQVIGDEFPVDTGKNPRRIDILARDDQSGDYIVIEVKRAEVQLDAIVQLKDYVGGLSGRENFSGTDLHAVLVAERIPPKVIAAAEAAGIAAYEIAYPLTFRRLA